MAAAVYHKLLILESIESLDQNQIEKVIHYIKELGQRQPVSHLHQQRLRHAALKQIQEALNEKAIAS